MKIIALTVTDGNGSQHTWEGQVGYVNSMELRESTDSKQSAGRLLGVQVIAHLTIPPDEPREPRTVHRSAVSGEFTTAEDAAEHPDTTVTEQVDR